MKGGNKMALQDRMIFYRAKNRLSQKDLADRCGVSVQTICSIENGTQEPSRLTRAKIVLVVGTDKKEGE